MTTMKRRVLTTNSATALLAAASVVGITITPVVHALDADCQTPDGNPYSGYSLQTGTGCTGYVNCANGRISGPPQTCPGGLLFNGAVGEGGICNWASAVACRDPAHVAAHDNSAANNAAANSGNNSAQTQAQTQAQAQKQTVQHTYTQTVQQTSVVTPPASYSNSNNNNSNNNNYNYNDNPENHFCGSDKADAARMCIPCPDMQIQTCLRLTGDYSHGCFKHVNGCRKKQNQQQAQSQQNQSQQHQKESQQQQAQQQAQQQQQQQQTQTQNRPDDNSNSLSNIIANALDNSVGNIMDSFKQGLQQTQQTQQAPSYQQNQYNQPRPPPQQQQQQNQYNQYNQPRPFVPAPTPPVYIVPKPTPPATAPAPSPKRSDSLPPWTNAPFSPTPWKSSSKTVIGYYAGWQWYDRNKFADPTNIDFSKYDRINYAFFQPCPLGNLYGTDSWGDPQVLWGPYTYNAMDFTPGNRFCSWDGPLVKNCNYHQKEKGLIHLAKTAGAQVMPSIGGWTLSDNFPGIAASYSKRQNFAQQCIDLILEYDFDGIDLDWEYPGYEDHSGTPADTENFTLLLQVIRDKLDQLGRIRGRFYGLTAALPCGPDKIEKIQVNRIKNILTELNLMSYDMHGAWDTLSGTNAPMFDQGWGDTSQRWSTHGCVNTYQELGVPLEQMNIGLPFYGRSVIGATGMKQFHGGADDINYHLDEGSPQYFNIVNELGRMKTYRHEKTQTQYAVFNNGGGLVSYDDPRAICDKVDYANKRGLKGFLIWEISGDMFELSDGTVYTPLIDATNRKIQDPNYDCSRLRDPVSNLDYNIAPPEPATVDWSSYEGPANTGGSANDFSGAQENTWAATAANTWSAPAPGPSSNNYNNPSQNSVYIPSPTGSGNSGGASSSSRNGNICPPDLGVTGYYPAPGCKTYAYCQNGSVLGAMMPCVPGTLFDKKISVCQFARNVNCDV